MANRPPPTTRWRRTTSPDKTLASNKRKSKGTQVAQADDTKTQSDTGKTAAGDAKPGNGTAKSITASPASSTTTRDDTGLIPSNFKAPTPVETAPLAPARTGKRSQTTHQDAVAAANNPDSGDTRHVAATSGNDTTGNNGEEAPHVMPGENVAALDLADTERGAPTTASIPTPKIYYAGSTDKKWDWSGQQVALNGY